MQICRIQKKEIHSMPKIKLTTTTAALVIFLLTFLVYLFPITYDLLHKPFFTWANGQDVASTSVLPIQILEHGDFYLDAYKEFFTTNWREPYFVAAVNGHLVSRSPVSAAVVALPFYGIPLGTGWLRHTGYAWLTFAWSAFFPAKFAAALLTALAVVMFFFCARALSNLNTALPLALMFGFSTSVWSTASQALWQQTPSIFFQLIGIWFLLRGHRKGATAAAPAAFFFSAATVSRPNAAIPALLFTVFFAIQHRAALLTWVAWALPPALLAFAYNWLYNGSPLVFGYQDGLLNYISAPQLDALAGLFISPSRGLLVYSPYLILAGWGFWLARSTPEKLFYRFCGIIFVLYVINLSMWQNWDGGWGYGTRLLTDALPYASILLIPAFARLNRRGRWLIYAAACYAAVIQSFGLWDYGVRWHWHWDNYAYNNWDIAENEPLFYLKQYIQMGAHYLARFFHS